MSRAPELPRLVNFSDSDMSTDSDSEDGKGTGYIISERPLDGSFDVESNNVDNYGKSEEFKESEVTEQSLEETVSKNKNHLLTAQEWSSQQLGETSASGSMMNYKEGGTSRERSISRGRRSRSWEKSRSRSRRRSDSRGRRSSSRGRRSASRGRRSRSSRGRSRSGDRSRSRGRSGSRSKRTRSRSRSRSRSRRRRSHSGSRGRYRRSNSRTRHKHRSRSKSRRRKGRRHYSPRRSRRGSPPRAYRTLDTLEKLGIELKPAPIPEQPQPPIPAYYNRLAVNPDKYAQQIAKRKLLWGSKTSEEGTAKASTWQGATFSQDQDGKMSAKFKRLMGIKGESTSSSGGDENKGQDLIKRQQELFSSMELQYEAARQATHTQRGVGLGFSSHPHHYP